MNPLPLIIGHRGASARAPENTLAAFKLAIDSGADGVEFDVRLAKDGVPVVIHDADLRRVAGRRAAVSDLTAAELGETDVGSWFHRAFPRAGTTYSGETVPRLEQVLGLLESSAGPIFLELKTEASDPGDLVANCSHLIGVSELLPRLIVKSFSLIAIERVKQRLPQVETAALFEPAVKTMFRRRTNLVDLAARSGASHISLHWSLVSRRLIEAAHEKRLPVTVWTVDQPAWIAKARRLGLRSLITNDPAKLLAVRDRALSES